MFNLIIFNKPYGVISQFSPKPGKKSLADYIETPKFYPAGRLDQDSEGLLLLTNDGKLQARIAEPKFKLPKTYWSQVEGDISQHAIDQLKRGVDLKDGKTKPARVNKLDDMSLPARQPPIRQRKNIPTSWIELTIQEGKNRQVRRMTAAVGFPTLRLYRTQIGPWHITGIEPGKFTVANVNLPVG